MNLRDIKKDIEYLVGEFIDEAVDLYNDLKDKVSEKTEGNKKAYYNGIRQELVEGLDKLCEKLSQEISK